jgi:hypothetical protein
MTKQEAIEKAKEINAGARDQYQPDITHVAMNREGLWYGYDQEPIFDEDAEEWVWWNTEIPLFDMADTKEIMESVSEI